MWDCLVVREREGWFGAGLMGVRSVGGSARPGKACVGTC